MGGNLRIAVSALESISVEQRTGAQQFRCNYDMKNGETSCHMNSLI